MTSLDRIQIVFSRRPDGVSEDDWNTWYDAHLHEILAIPGFVSAQRFAIDQQVGAGEGPEWTHIALYQVEGELRQARGGDDPHEPRLGRGLHRAQAHGHERPAAAARGGTPCGSRRGTARRSASASVRA